MRLSRFAFFCVVLLVAVTGASAAIRSLPISTDENELTLIDRPGDTLHYRVQVGELSAMDVQTKQGEFTRLLIPGFHSSHEEGAPELPMMNRLVEIPQGSHARIEIITDESREIDLAEYGIEQRLFPAQPSMPKNADPETWPFVLNESAYQVDRVARELVQVVPVGRMRAVNIGRLEISPVEYFPAENKIRVHERIELRVVFEDVDHAAELELKAGAYSPFFEGVYEQIDGYRTPHTDHPDLVDDVVTMVVITPSTYVPYLQEFVDWKTQRGFNVIVGVTGTPEVGSTTTSIQAYIRGLYNNPAPGYQAPSFVVLVGDVEQVPSFNGSGITDRPYCAVDADLLPDIYYGRLPAATTTQLQNMLDKTMMYDQFTMPDPAYLGEVVMIAGVDGSHGAVWANGQINYGTTYYFNAAHGIFSHTHLYPQSGSDDAIIVQEVSDGCAYVNYTAHGSETSWSDPTFTQANVRSLQNAGEYCLAVGNCCLAMSFQISECFGETWLREANRGAIGYIGGSNNTYWDEDYWWGVGYRASIVSNPVYDANGLGAYDGIFHDHGEAMDQWYVTNDAIVFCGNLAVTQSGSSLTSYYWDIYGLLGDPSISTYQGVPTENPVVHPSTLFTTWSSVEIEAVPNSYVGLTKDGEIIAAGTVGESGTVELPFLATPLQPGTAQIVVMAQFREPYMAEINVIVPAAVYITPSAIDADVETAVAVGVFEYDGITPKPGIEVWAEGVGYESAHAMTQANGYCNLLVDYPFGPTVDIVGQDPAQPWELFREALPVNALTLIGPNLTVTTDIGLSDAFALNLPGTLHASGLDTGTTLWAISNGEVLGSTTQRELTVTPSAGEVLTGVISKPGYDVYAEDFPVLMVYGTVSGHVTAGGSAAVGAIVRGYDAAMTLVFEATTNASGNYSITEEVLVQNYTVTCDHFGYLHWEQPYLLGYGANFLDITMAPAPSGTMTGVITETGTGVPLEATVRLYRSDTGALYAQTTSDPDDGSYTTPALPYFDYDVNVRALRHIPAEASVTISGPVQEMDFALVATPGDLLVINDSAKEKAAADIVNDLDALGYVVTLEAIGATNPATWGNYDLLIVSCGNNTGTLANATFRTALRNYVMTGGHLLVEGGEVCYEWRGDADFATTVLHISAWTHGVGGNVTIVSPTHNVMSVPNVISGPIVVTTQGYADEDAVLPAAGTVRVGAYASYPLDGSVLACDSNPNPVGGQFALFPFNYSRMNATSRRLLLHNTVTWLVTPESAGGSVSGVVRLEGQTDHSGIRVEAVPNGGYVITDASGAFTLPSLYAGRYNIVATKAGWSAQSAQMTLSDGEQFTGVSLWLTTTTTTAEECSTVNLPIADNAEVSDAISMNVDATVSDIEVFVDITHPYIGDLVVWLVSPWGTEIRLHNRTGLGNDNISGWYPSQLTPAQSLAALVGEPTDGEWVLHVRDNSAPYVGQLNSWCVRLTYGTRDPSALDDEALPKRLALYATGPNPVRGATAIAFDLPQAGEVELAVFDVAGRRVKSLVAGELGPGSYETVWQGTDDNGQRVSSAVYFYRLRANGQTITQKVMLID